MSSTKAHTRIWIARHGQTEANKSGLFCGQSETTLTEFGREQARALGGRLRDVPIAAAYASDLSRAVQTATIVLDGRSVSLQMDPALREIFYGEWEMKREAAIRRDHPEQFKKMRDEDPAWHPTGGENPQMVRERTIAAIRSIAARHRGQDVLVISHGTAINCMLSEILGIAPTHVFRFDVSNCGLSQVAAANGRLVVLSLNDTAHLPPPPDPKKR